MIAVYEGGVPISTKNFKTRPAVLKIYKYRFIKPKLDESWDYW